MRLHPISIGRFSGSAILLITRSFFSRRLVIISSAFSGMPRRRSRSSFLRKNFSRLCNWEPGRRSGSRFWRLSFGWASGAELGCRLHCGSGRSDGGGVWFSCALPGAAHAARERVRADGASDSGLAFCFLASALSKEMGLIFLLLWLIIFFAQAPRAGLVGTIGIVVGGAGRLSESASAGRTSPGARRLRRLRFSLGQSWSHGRSPNTPGCSFFHWHLHMERDVETHPSGFGRREFERGGLARTANPARDAPHRRVGAIRSLAARRRPAIFLPLLLAVALYLPVSGLVTLNATVAEHWLYLPSAFLFLGRSGRLDSLGGDEAAPEYCVVCA